MSVFEFSCLLVADGLCSNTCNYAADGDCDDGGPNSDYSGCSLGTDCTDCGSRAVGRPLHTCSPLPRETLCSNHQPVCSIYCCGHPPNIIFPTQKLDVFDLLYHVLAMLQLHVFRCYWEQARPKSPMACRGCITALLQQATCSVILPLNLDAYRCFANSI